jgi:hypothetical protein
VIAFAVVFARAVVLTLVAGQLAPLPSIERVRWLQGCWATERDGRIIEAQWLPPRASSMLGVGRTTRGATLVEYEMVLIRERGGQLSYETHPSDQQPGLFMSDAIDERSIEFENLKHEFPQRIGYERTASGQLLVWMDGRQGGQMRRLESRYDRIPCPGE